MTPLHGVDPGDEQRHRPDPDDLWNESYYADFVHEDGTFGGWLRLGLLPQPGRGLVDHLDRQPRPAAAAWPRSATTFPVPAGTGLVSEDPAIRIELETIEPLQQFRIAASAPAAHHGDPAAVYDGAPGTAGPARPGPDLDHRRLALPLPLHHPLRDPLHGGGDRHHRRRDDDRAGPGPARPLLGRARLVGLRVVLVLGPAGRRHPGAPGRHPHPRRPSGLRLCADPGRRRPHRHRVARDRGPRPGRPADGGPHRAGLRRRGRDGRRPRAPWPLPSPRWPSGRRCCATTTGGPAASRGPWCATRPRTGGRAWAGSSGISPRAAERSDLVPPWIRDRPEAQSESAPGDSTNP